MIKRIFLAALLLLLLLAPSSALAESDISVSNPACHSERSAEARDPSLSLGLIDRQAESGISVIDSSVEIDFPLTLVFHLEAESSADIVDARLHYQVDKMKYAQVTSEAWLDFTPATRVEGSWTWDMRRSSLPPGAAVTYWWTLKDAAGEQVESPASVLHFVDNRYEWRSLTSGELTGGASASACSGGGVTLFWYKGGDDFARELMNTCEEGLARLSRDIGTCPERPINIYIYASADDLQQAMIFPQEWTGGVAFTEFGIIAIGITPAQLEWGKGALVHELTHLVVHQVTFSPYGRLPVWLDEGLAMYNQGDSGPSLRSMVEKAASEGSLISVRSLCSPFSAQPEKAYLSYAESYSLVEYLLQNYSPERMLKLLALFREGNAYDEALEQAYGFDIVGLESRWHEALKSALQEAAVAGIDGKASVVFAGISEELVE